MANQDWSPSEIDAFVKRAELGTVVIERANGRNRLRAECKVPGAYVSYAGKQGVGRLWGTNRPLLHPDEVGRDCAGATHLVATFVRNGARFEAILVPLPCPPTDDAKPAPHCIARGLTGPERLERSTKIQDLLAPALRELHPPRPRKAASERRVGPAASGTTDNAARGNVEASNGKMLEMWALTPDDYPAVEWLNELRGDCALYEQTLWYTRAYSSWPHTGGRRRPPDPRLDPGMGAGLSSTCLAWPVFLDCFPALVELPPGCLPAYH